MEQPTWDLLQAELGQFGQVTVTGEGRTLVISVTTDKFGLRNLDLLKKWRKLCHKRVSELTGGSWHSERGSTHVPGDKCRTCGDWLGEFQRSDCFCCCKNSCNCIYGLGSKKGYGQCPELSDVREDACKPAYVALYNVVHVYESGSNAVPKMPGTQRSRNEFTALMRCSEVLLLANQFCFPGGHVEDVALTCPFAIIKLPRDILYRIIMLCVGGKKKRKSFKSVLKRVSQ